MVTSNGSSPLTVRGLDPGMMYSVMINVFDGNQVVLSNQTVNQSITVMSGNSGKILYKHVTVNTICVMFVFKIIASATYCRWTIN